jgi:hypothetical protein
MHASVTVIFIMERLAVINRAIDVRVIAAVGSVLDAVEPAPGVVVVGRVVIGMA